MAKMKTSICLAMKGSDNQVILSKRLAIRHLWWWDYMGHLPIRYWVFSSAHDTSSMFWRIVGFEITLRRDKDKS
jgi:hypothetical protein